MRPVDLLAPNLNKEKMQYMAKMERESQKNAAQSRKDRDKAALDKQRCAAAILPLWSSRIKLISPGRTLQRPSWRSKRRQPSRRGEDDWRLAHSIAVHVSAYAL